MTKLKCGMEYKIKLIGGKNNELGNGLIFFFFRIFEMRFLFCISYVSHV